MPAIENRVRFDDYGYALAPGDPRLQPVISAGKKPQFAHWRAARAFEKMRAAALVDGFDLKVGSGWRPIRFETRAQYEAFLIQRYDSVAEGRKWLGWKGGHNLGLNLDIVGEGLEIKSATTEAQKRLPVYRWLVDNAYRFGFTPYLAEAWHWELNVGKDKWEDLPPSWGKRIAAGLGVAAAIAAGVFLYRRRRPRVVVVVEDDKS